MCLLPLVHSGWMLVAEIWSCLYLPPSSSVDIQAHKSLVTMYFQEWDRMWEPQGTLWTLFGPVGEPPCPMLCSMMAAIAKVEDVKMRGAENYLTGNKDLDHHAFAFKTCLRFSNVEVVPFVAKFPKALGLWDSSIGVFAAPLLRLLHEDLTGCLASPKHFAWFAAKKRRHELDASAAVWDALLAMSAYATGLVSLRPMERVPPVPVAARAAFQKLLKMQSSLGDDHVQAVRDCQADVQEGRALLLFRWFSGQVSSQMLPPKSARPS